MQTLKQRSGFFVLAASMAVLLQACGGGSGTTTSEASGPTTTLSGIAAVGAPLVGSTVEFQCAAGKPANATTGADGAWTSAGTGITLPCAIEVSGGTVNGAANTAKLHSFANAAGLNNVTTLTTLLAELLAGQDPAAWFAQLKTSPAALKNITAAQRTGALTQLAELLKTLPTPVELPAGFDPVTTKFVADPKTDKFDQLLEKLAANGIPLAEIVAQANEKTPTALTLAALSGFGGDLDPVSGAVVDTHEVPAYDPASKRLFVVNGSGADSVEVWNIADPKSPQQVGTLKSADFGAGMGGFNSVAIHNGVVALAIEAKPKTNNGIVALVKASDLSTISTVGVGALPDMVTFSPDGRYVLTANEGEPNSYNQPDSIDPEGSISVIDVADVKKPVVKTAGFTDFNAQIDSLRAKGVRIFGPGASVAQDLEPEYVTVSSDSKTAYVTMQEANAIAVVDIATAKVTDIRALGTKDHSLAGFGMDTSKADDAAGKNPEVNIRQVPVKGMYMPDAIANYTVAGKSFLVTANEGDVRDYTGFKEEMKVEDCVNLTGTLASDSASLLNKSMLGKLVISAYPNGDKAAKDLSTNSCSELYSFGGRSFTIWDAATGERVFDSGDELKPSLQNCPKSRTRSSNSIPAIKTTPSIAAAQTKVPNRNPSWCSVLAPRCMPSSAWSVWVA